MLVRDLTEALLDKCHKKVESAMEDRVEVEITQAIKDVLDEGVIQTDRFGDPTCGEKKSLRAWMVDGIEAFMGANVGADGTTRTCSAYGSGGLSRIKWLASHMSDQVWEKNIQKLVDQQIVNAKAEMRERVEGHMATKLRELFKIE